MENVLPLEGFGLIGIGRDARRCGEAGMQVEEGLANKIWKKRNLLTLAVVQRTFPRNYRTKRWTKRWRWLRRYEV